MNRRARRQKDEDTVGRCRDPLQFVAVEILDHPYFLSGFDRLTDFDEGFPPSVVLGNDS